MTQENQTPEPTSSGQPTSKPANTKSNHWSVLDKVLDKIPKMPVDFGMLIIVYIVIVIGCSIMAGAGAMVGLSPEQSVGFLYGFFIITAIFLAAFLIYFFLYRLPRK